MRGNLLELFAGYLNLDGERRVGTGRPPAVVEANIVHGDALTMTTHDGDKPITFPEWGYVGKGKFQRRDFRFASLAADASFGGDTFFVD